MGASPQRWRFDTVCLDRGISLHPRRNRRPGSGLKRAGRPPYKVGRVGSCRAGGCAGDCGMASEKPDILLLGPPKSTIANGLAPLFSVHRLIEAKDQDALMASLADRVRGFAVTFSNIPIDGALMSRFPRLEIVASFGVGYDHIDAKWAAQHGIVATNTPEVLNEEVADTALGLLLCTVREFPQAERFVRAGTWVQKGYQLSRATLRDRTVGMVGMGRIGKAIARRLEAFGV